MVYGSKLQTENEAKCLYQRLSDSDICSPEGKKACNSPRSEPNISVVFSEDDQVLEALNMIEKIATQLERIFAMLAGKYSDNVCQEGNTIITNDQSEFSLCAPQRHSFDNELNNHGKRLLEICRSADLTIMNGRSHGDSLGRPTFHGKSGVSVVDYAICDQDLFHSIANFVVREPSSLSDHSPIMTWLNITKVNNHLVTENTNDTLIRLPRQFIWENDSSQKFKTALQTRDIQRMIHDFLVDSRPDKHINSSLDTVERILFTTAKRCLKIKNVKKRYTRLFSVSSNKKWFDKECRLKRHELRKLANLKHRDPLNIMLRENYHTVLKQ